MAKKSLLFCWAIFLFFCCDAQSPDTLVARAVRQAEFLRIQEGDVASAIEVLQQTVQELKAQGVPEGLSLVPLYHKLGVNHYSFGQYLEAEPYTTRALRIREQAFGKVHIDVAKGYYLRAILHRELQSYGSAQKDLDAAISSMEALLSSGKSQETYRLIWMFEESIRLQTILRNNTLAFQYWDKAFAFYAQEEEANFFDLIALHKNKGDIYYNQQKYEQAEQAYGQAIALYGRYGEVEKLPESVATIYSDRGVMQFKQGKYEAARSSYHLARRGFERLLAENESPRFYQKLGVVYANLLELSGKTENYEDVATYSDKALQYYQQGFGTIYHPNLATLYRDEASIVHQQGKTRAALDLNQKAIQALVPDFTSSDPLDLVNLDKYVIKDKIAFLETLRQRAGLLMSMSEQQNGDQQYLQSAFQNYLTLDTVVTQIRQSYNAAGSQFDLIEQSYPIYEQAILAALLLAEQSSEQHYLELAYYFAARNKALVLLGGIQEQQAQSFSSIPETLQAEERKLKKSIFQLESELYDLGGTADTQQLRDSLFSLQREYQNLIRHFEDAYPDYYASKYGFDQGVGAERFRHRLPPETAIVEFFVGEEQVFIFILSSQGLDYHRMAKPAGFEQLASSFREQLQQPENALVEWGQNSHQLYQWLLEDALAKPAVNRHISHLVIIPDGVLMQLPFDVLSTNSEASSSAYLLRKYAISYAYSNRLLFGERKGRTTSGTFAGFGLEYDDYTLNDLSATLDRQATARSLDRALGKLQYSDDEVVEIAALLTGDQWINSGACRDTFLQNADQYAILHLAMHGLLNEEYPMNSALVFARQNDSTEYFLRASDLYNMKLNADMTVLSACNTGAGALQKGEGVRSLARAFSYAGCPSLVASLWNASDKSTKDILIDFYKNLTAGMTKHEAMRQAKLAYLDTAPPAYQVPYYWSHLSVIGDSSELAVLSPVRLRNYALYGLVLFLAVAGFLLWRRRK